MRQKFDFSDLSPSQLFWLFALSCPWVYWIVSKANEVHAREQAELAKRSFFGKIWYGPGPTFHWILIAIIFGLIGLLVIVRLSQGAAAAQEWLIKKFFIFLQERKHARQKQEFDEKMRLMDAQAERDSALSKSAQSKKELIIRLGSIDQFICVLETETDSARRTVALQAASSELTALSAKLASGEIFPEATIAPEVQQAAKETSFDLEKVGLAEDRLNRDLQRIFKLKDNQPSQAA